MRFFFYFLYKSICCGNSFELHRQVDAIQMSIHNICLYKKVDKKYTGCNLKITELLDCALIGVCAVIGSNTVYNYNSTTLCKASWFLCRGEMVCLLFLLVPFVGYVLCLWLFHENVSIISPLEVCDIFPQVAKRKFEFRMEMVVVFRIEWNTIPYYLKCYLQPALFCNSVDRFPVKSLTWHFFSFFWKKKQQQKKKQHYFHKQCTKKAKLGLYS